MDNETNNEDASIAAESTVKKQNDRQAVSPEKKAAYAERKRAARQAATPEKKAADAERKRAARKVATPEKKSAEASRRRASRKPAALENEAEVERRRSTRKPATPDKKAADAERKRAARQAATLHKKTTTAKRKRNSTPAQKAVDAARKRNATPESKATIAERKRNATPAQKAADAARKRNATPVQKAADAARKRNATPVRKAADATRKRNATPVRKAADAARKRNATPVRKAADAARKRNATPVRKAADTSRKRNAAPEKKSATAKRRRTTTNDYKSSYEKLKERYFEAVKKLPTFICSSCGGLFYEESTCIETEDSLKQKGCSDEIIAKVLYVRQEHHRLCTTCRKYVRNAHPRIPRMCLANGLDFPPIPPELQDLSPLEERLVALRTPFMQIRLLGSEKQSMLRGNVVNVENDLDVCAEVLPRKFDQTSTVQVQLMRRMKYRSPYMYETIRPQKVYVAAQYLMSTELYISQNITLSEDWRYYQEGDKLQFKCEEGHENDHSDRETEESEEEEDSESSNEQPTIGVQETLIFNEAEAPLGGIRIAPSEGKTPIPLFLDSFAEEMSFPTIYAGIKRQHADGVRLTYTDIAKSEIRRYDRRACKPSRVLYAFKRSFNEKVQQAVQVCMRKTTVNGRLNAGSVRTPGFIEGLLQKDEGYAIFRNIRASPLYWKEKSKSVLAMVRQLGKCTFFITLSAAETKWSELLVALMKLLKDKGISEEEAKNLSFQEVSELISSDPVTCMRHFEHKHRSLLKFLLKEPLGIFAPYRLTDYFTRMEFQMRGSPHSHGLYWIKDAPAYIEDNEDSIAACIKFIDEFITCERAEDGKMEHLIGYQLHKHSTTCKKKANLGITCRFFFPKPPLNNTMILKPIAETEMPESERKNYQTVYHKIEEKLNEMGRSFKEVIEYDTFLEILGLVHVDYVNAIRSTLKRTTVFLKRSTNAAFINPYNRNLLEAWEANIDVQFVLDTYACARYCVGYIMKANGDLSKTLQAATKDVRNGNFSTRDKLKRFANILINGSEISAQEAAAFLLGTPNTTCSRVDVFINTGLPNERIRMLKSKEELEELEDSSNEVVAQGLIEHYTKRPEVLNNICLAEFASMYEFQRNKASSADKVVKNFEDDDHEETEETNIIPTKSLILLDNSGSVRKRRNRKIIRFRHYGKAQDTANYYREQVMLFLPWRDEEDDLLSKDMLETFQANVHVILENSEPFYFDREIDDLILQDLSEDLEEDSNEAEECNIVSNHMKLMQEDKYSELDILEEMGDSNRVEHFLPPKLVLEAEYVKIMRALNERQQKFVLNVLHLLKVSCDPFYMFLSGGAGVGKSHTITAIVQSYIRYNNQFPTTHPEDICVVVAAPTGKAAFNVFGMTLHCTFKLPPNQNSDKLCNLDSSKLNTLRCKLLHVKLFIIDEISMVSNRQFYDIDQRLRQIFATSTAFGGKSVIVVGHLRQLPPVAGTYVFKPPSHLPLGVCVGNHLWELFSLYELDEIMRQKGEMEFCKALNNMAEGVMDEADVSLIKSREICKGNIPPDSAIRLFSSNEECQIYNDSIHKKLKTDGALSVAFDSIQGKGSVSMKKSLLEYGTKMTSQQSNGIPYSVHLQVEGEYFVSTNVDVQDGLFNGSSGCLKLIEYGTTHDNQKIPKRCWLDFRNSLVGASKRINTKRYQLRKNINTDWTCIDRVTKKLSETRRYKGLEIIRNQIPLVAANGMTIHKSQGSSIPVAVVSVGRYKNKAGKLARKITRELLYVGCSRATSLKGLFIDGTFEPPATPPENDLVTKEMDRLRNQSFHFELKFLQDFGPSYVKVYFHNVQSFPLHLSDLIADKCAMESDYLALVEPHLLADDTVEVPNFICAHRTNCRGNRNSEGAAVFSKVNCGPIALHVNFTGTAHFVMVDWKVSEVQLIMVYKSPKYGISRFLEKLRDILTAIQGPCVVFGDFNINLQIQDGKKLIGMFAEFDMVPKLNIQQATTNGGTHIDCCFSNSQNVTSWVYESYYSYHKPICIVWPRN